MRDLSTRLRLKSTGQGLKAVSFGVLVLLGCCSWVPMLMRASSSRQAAPAGDFGVSSFSNLASLANASANSILLDGDRSPFWKSLAETLATDPLFSPADMSLSTRDPFLRDADSLPVPIQTEPHPLVKIEAKSAALDGRTATGLELQSTMVGRTRRVALINGRMYHQGQDVSVNGQRYQLAVVESQRVVLINEGQDFVLAMPRSKLRDALSQNEEARE